MEELKKLIEALGKAFEQFKAENDSRIKAIEAKGHADPLLIEKVEKINADISNISAMKKQLELLENAVARAQFGGGGAGQTPEAMNRLKAFNHLMRRGAQDIKELEVQAAASTLSDPDGGFTVPEEVDAAIDRVAGTIQAMRRLATVRTISTDTYKKLVNQGGATSGWVAEKESRTETSTPTLAEIAINTKELYAMPYATQTLLDDSRVDIGAWLAEEVSVEFNEEEGKAFISGNGVGEPKGIDAYTKVANASYAWGKVGYIAGGHATLLNNADKLIDLQHALKPVYRNGAQWLMADSTMQVIRKFKDGEGNYLWRPGLLQDAPDTLLGKPVEYDDNVAAIGAGSYSIFYGNFKRAYLIVDRLGTRVLRDPYTAKPYVAFYTTKRVGGGLVHYEALKALKIAAS
jgi:HK97 family phage major capsid protein